MNAIVRLVAALLVCVVCAVAQGPAGGSAVVSAAAGDCPAAAHHAEVVLQHSSGASLAVCVGFDTSSISGVDLLRRSGIQQDLQDFGGAGAAVCQLDNEPQPVPPGCFGTSDYWALFVSRACSPWQYASSGVSSMQLADGDLAGFHHVPQSGRATPPARLAGDCPPTAAAAPPTPAPTPAPATPASTAVPAPPATARGVVPAPSSPPPPATPSPVATVPPASAVAVLPVQSATPSPAGAGLAGVSAGPVRRTGEAPPAAASGAPLWGWLLAGLIVTGLAASFGARVLRRRGRP